MSVMGREQRRDPNRLKRWGGIRSPSCVQKAPEILGRSSGRGGRGGRRGVVRPCGRVCGSGIRVVRRRCHGGRFRKARAYEPSLVAAPQAFR